MIIGIARQVGGRDQLDARAVATIRCAALTAARDGVSGISMMRTGSAALPVRAIAMSARSSARTCRVWCPSRHCPATRGTR